jgi:elongation factor P--(R)-beta-lysine ligase
VKKLKWILALVNTFQELTKSDKIKIRSRCFKKARDFLYSKNYFEVDCPILSPYAALDNHIDLITTSSSPTYYLHSSPEYGMKKLLSLGAPSIFQLSHVFRAFEKGARHAQEFTMLEFYKLNISFDDFIQETCDLIELFTGKKTREFLSYKDAFIRWMNLNPYKDIDLIQKQLDSKLDFDSSNLDPDDILSMAMSTFIEPQFDKNSLTIVYDFPQTQAALAESKHDLDDNYVSYRFEIYHKHLELANGYKELKCSQELKTRFNKLNQLRLTQSKDHYPVDEMLLKAMENYFPDCCGVAIGFDRLLMIELEADNISDVLSLPSV